MKNIFFLDQNNAYIIEGSGRAISNRNYVQGILAFAVYVKDLCNLLLPSVNHPLAKAPGKHSYLYSYSQHILKF